MGKTSCVKRFLKNFCAFLWGIIFCLILIAVTEGILRLVVWDPHIIQDTTYDPLPYKARDQFGIVCAPAGVYRATQIRKDLAAGTAEVIYDATYTIGRWGERVTPQDKSVERASPAIFFGGSYTFGEGLLDNQTIPYYFADGAKEYIPYNLGFHGDGPFDILAKVENFPFDTVARHQKGVIIYILINGHIFRVKGDMRELSWGEDRPYYKMSNGRIIRSGNFFTGRPLTTRLLRLCNKSKILQVLGIRRLLPVTNHDITLTAETIKTTFAIFKKKLPGFERYLVIYPHRKQEPRYYARVLERLKNEDFHILDYSGLFDPNDQQYQIPGDGHPSAAANRVLAERLIQDLRLKNIHDAGRDAP